MTNYDITIELHTRKAYRVEAETAAQAETKAIDIATKEFPLLDKSDFWVASVYREREERGVA